MLSLTREKTTTLVAIHGRSGISLGILLYAVVVTGTVSVFAEENAHWSAGLVATANPQAPAADADATPLQDTVDRLAPAVDPDYLKEVALGRSTQGHLTVSFHKHRTNDAGDVEEVGTEFEVDPGTDAVIVRQDGTGLELFETDEDRALSRFLVSVHTELHLPLPWGLLLTGIVGLAMMVAAVSGVLMHRHLLKDLFTLRRGANRLVQSKDAHTVAGSWILPFAFLLAFTGSFFSFAGSFGLPLIATVGFGGDQQAMLETMLGGEAPEDSRRVGGRAIDHLVQDVRFRTGGSCEFIVIEHCGRADAGVNLFLPPRQEGLAPRTFVYQGVTGAFVKEKPQLGQTHSLGATLFSLMGPLHFGDFKGLFSKIIWAALGFAMAYVTMTGMRLWLARRSAAGFTALRWGVGTKSFGLPVALLGSTLAFCLSYGNGAASFCTPVGFVLAAVLVLFHAALIRDPARINEHLRLAATVGCGALPAVRILTGGPGWGAAVAAHQSVLVAVDLLSIEGGLALFCTRRGHPMETAPEDATEPSRAGCGHVVNDRIFHNHGTLPPWLGPVRSEAAEDAPEQAGGPGVALRNRHRRSAPWAHACVLRQRGGIRAAGRRNLHPGLAGDKGGQPVGRPVAVDAGIAASVTDQIAVAWIDRLTARLVRYRWWSLVLVALLTVGAVNQLPNLTIDNSNEAFFLEGDPTQQRLDDFQDTATTISSFG